MLQPRQSVEQLRATPKSVGGCLQSPVSVEAVGATIGSMLELVPSRNLEPQSWQQHRLNSTVAETRAQRDKGLVLGQYEVVSRVAALAESAIIHPRLRDAV